MSYKITKLVVSKGRTISHEKEGEWIREHYELEIVIPDEHELSIARENAVHLLDDWLGLAGIATQPQNETLNVEAIKWELQPGLNNPKGPFEKSQDFNNPNHKSLVKKLAAKKGFLRHKSFQYWLYKNGSTVGRRALKKTASGGS